jgi:hypothetical protein
MQAIVGSDGGWVRMAEDGWTTGEKEEGEKSPRRAKAG